MRIVVAGAGAGKTTSMATTVLDRLSKIEGGKIIYVVTYTNAAKDRIREKIKEATGGSIPKQLLIETLHAFMIREFIFPYHHIIYDQVLSKISYIKLSDNLVYRKAKLKELSSGQKIHVELVTQTARWILCGKSNDKKIVKERRRKVLNIISHYLDSIFIDEAQDIDDNVKHIVEALDRMGLQICLIGDPKQDLRGRNVLKGMISTYQEKTEYRSENHRCPVSHIDLANMFILDAEKQTPKNEKLGELSYILESDVNVQECIKQTGWDHIYIIRKNDRYMTHEYDGNMAEENLAHELKVIIKKTEFPYDKHDQILYFLMKNVLKNIHSNNFSNFSLVEKSLNIRLSKQDKGKLGQALDWNRESSKSEGILVESIDSVKGLEGDQCLFILTPDLAAYLFSEKTERNKMMNYLYVALTRSKEKLTFLVTREVEEKYGAVKLSNFLDSLGIRPHEDVQRESLVPM